MSRFRLPFSLAAVKALFVRPTPEPGTAHDPRNTRLMFTASEQNVSVVFENKLYSIPASEPSFAPLKEHLTSVPEGEPHNYELVESLVNKPKAMSRLTEGLATVEGSTVYYRGEPVHSTLATKLVQMVDAGMDAAPWSRFLERVMQNPDERSRRCLFDFLNTWEAPITEDGHFIAFKRVRSNWTSIHSSPDDTHMSHKPGEVVWMPRNEVDSNPNNQCSRGLHCCATSYLGHFYAVDSSSLIIAVKVDPADVCAVPADYGFAKMRVCRYLVLGLASQELYENATAVPVAYIGTEAATGDVVDMDGKPICYNANDFAENWKRLQNTEFKVGDLVAITPHAQNDELPQNGYMIGELVASETFDEDTCPDHLDWDDFDGVDMVVSWEIEWQDGTSSDDVFTYPNSSSDNEVEKVEFIGEREDVKVEDHGDGSVTLTAAPGTDLRDVVGPLGGDDEEEEEPTLCDDCEEVIPNWKQFCDDCEDRRNEEDDDALGYDPDEEDCGICSNCGEDAPFDGGLCDECEEEELREMEEAEAEDEIDEEPNEMAFTRNGVTYPASAIMAGIEKHGQRGYSRLTGIPRTTLQDWKLKIEVTED